MRVLLILIIVSALAAIISAQTTEFQNAFDDATREARNGRYESAIERYRQAGELAEKAKSGDNIDAKIHFNLGVCLYHLQKTAEAVREFTKTVEISHEKYPRVFYALGMAQKDLGNWGEAEKAFRQAIKSNAKDGEAWFDLAMVYVQERNIERAQEAFQNAVKYKSTATADAHNNLGVIYALGHNFQAAEKEFQMALLESRGASVEAVNNIKFCKYYRQNQSQELIAKLEFSKISTGN